jgi:hypothetical protein
VYLDVFLVFEITSYYPTCKTRLFSVDLVPKYVRLSYIHIGGAELDCAEHTKVCLAKLLCVDERENRASCIGITILFLSVLSHLLFHSNDTPYTCANCIRNGIGKL